MQDIKLINKIAIIGGGIIGLSTANIIQKRYPSAELNLISHKFFDLTTSWGAPGVVNLKLTDFDYKDTFRWYKKGTEHYWDLYRSENCEKSGILMTNFYYLSKEELNFPSNYGEIYPIFREVNSRELATIGFSSKFKYAVSHVTPIVESRYYLKYLADIFTENGGKIIESRVTPGKENVANWALKNGYDLIFNCSGFGSRELFEDKELIPLRGQLIRVDAPWFKHSFLTTDDTYAYSCKESVVLGGFRQKNDYDLRIRPHERQNILDRIREHNKCLPESRIIEEWCQLRPYREKLRLEIEYIESSSGIKVPVIHNYGHGSSGIGLSWGTSLEAVDLIDKIVPQFFRANM